MASRTARTVVGVLRAAVVRRLPLLTPTPSLLRIHDDVGGAELGLIRDAGYSNVLNRVHDQHARDLARRGSGGL